MTPAVRASEPFDTMLALTRARPDRADLAVALGLRALDERREEDALPVLTDAATRTPGNVNLLHVLGLLHRAIGDLAPAIDAFDRALAQGPGSARLVHARARVAQDAGLPSLNWYARARRLAPNDADVILGEAAALLAARRHRKAEQLLIDTLDQHPGWIAGHAALIRMRHAGGGSDKAFAQLDRAIAGAPGDPRLHRLKVTALHRGGDDEAALRALRAARAALGDDEVTRSLTAILATEHDSISAADAAFARVEPLSQPDLAIHWLRHLLRRGEPERVSALHGDLAPPNAEVVWPYLSLAWRLLGDPRHDWLDGPHFVKVIDFGEDWPLLPQLAETLRALHVSDGQPLDQSVRGGTQTDGPLLHRIDPVIAALRERLRLEVAAYIAALPAPDPAHPLLGHIPAHPRFVGSWSVRLAGGGFHEAHIHGEGRISSAFYISLPPADGVDKSGWLTLGEPQPSLGVQVDPIREIEPRRGRLVLFPSTMWHATRPFVRGERLTTAFDVA